MKRKRMSRDEANAKARALLLRMLRENDVTPNGAYIVPQLRIRDEAGEVVALVNTGWILRALGAKPMPLLNYWRLEQ